MEFLFHERETERVLRYPTGPHFCGAQAGFTLHTERLGPLPLINHFIERIGLHFR